MQKQWKDMQDGLLARMSEALESEACGSIDEVIELLEVTNNGKVIQSLNNCRTVLLRDPLLHMAIRRNELTCMTDIVRKMPWKRRGVSITDTDVGEIRLYLEKNYHLYNEKNIRTAIDIVASQNSYHPIRDYLESLVWDGTPRMNRLMQKYLGADDDDYTREVIRILLLGAIHRIYEPGCKFELMICLVGGQGAGKSTFFRFLAMKDEWFSDDLRRLDDDNVFRKLLGHWIIELSEMTATANARSIEEIKSFISRQKETYKVPYERNPEDRPRQCIFVGTSNNLDFLPLDRTGNRRFIPVLIHPERIEKHLLEDEAAARKYIEQCWAECFCIYRSGKFSLRFSEESESRLREMQIEFMPEDSKVGIIQNWLDHYDGDYVCSMMIYREALGHDGQEPKLWETREIAQIMNQSVTGWERLSSHRFKDYGIQRAWKRITERDGFVPMAEDETTPFS